MKPVDVLLIRGLAREKAHWGDFKDLLEKQKYVKKCRAIDLMGMGEFRNLTSPLTIRENAHFMISQLEQQRWQKGMIVSVSLGSMVAIEMAQLRPDLFEKVFVMNTSFSNLSPTYHRLQLKAMGSMLKISLAKEVEKREWEIIKMISQNRGRQKKVLKEWTGIAELRPMRLKNVIRQLIAAGTYRIAKKAPTVPVVVFNSKQDQMVHPSCSQKLSEHWKLPLFTHPKAGHDLCIDDPDWVIESISRNLSSD